MKQIWILCEISNWNVVVFFFNPKEYYITRLLLNHYAQTNVGTFMLLLFLLMQIVQNQVSCSKVYFILCMQRSKENKGYVHTVFWHIEFHSWHSSTYRSPRSCRHREESPHVWLLFSVQRRLLISPLFTLPRVRSLSLAIRFHSVHTGAHVPIVSPAQVHQHHGWFIWLPLLCALGSCFCPAIMWRPGSCSQCLMVTAREEKIIHRH